MTILPGVTFFINDWFLLVSLLVVYTIIWRLPRTFPWSVTLIIMLLSLNLAKDLDNVLGMKPLDAYDTNYDKGFDFSDFMLWLLYPPFGYLFIYIYHTRRISGLAIPVYLLAASLAGMAFEALAAAYGVYQYHHWKLTYSFTIYMFVQTVTLLLFHLIRKEVVRLQTAGKR